MDHDLAMAKLNLAGIAFTKRRKLEAQKLLQEAQKLDKRDMLSGTNQNDEATDEKGGVPNQHFGGQQRGGKRR